MEFIMGVKIYNLVLKQMEEILDDYNELKSIFKPLKFLGMLGAKQEEIAKTNGSIL